MGAGELDFASEQRSRNEAVRAKAVRRRDAFTRRARETHTTGHTRWDAPPGELHVW
jgi:hypothetical protein